VQRLLEARQRWQLLPRATVRQAAAELGLAPPLEGGQLQRLGDRLGVHLVLSGSVGKLALDRRRAAVAAQVRLELSETGSGLLLAAANGSGRASASREEPWPTDLVVEQALQRACAAALDNLLKAPLLCGRITARGGPQDFRTDLGRRAGLTPNRYVLILRPSSPGVAIAVAVARQVADDGAQLAITSATAEVRVDDLVLAP
jgi:hypothetical protein